MSKLGRIAVLLLDVGLSANVFLLLPVRGQKLSLFTFSQDHTSGASIDGQTPIRSSSLNSKTTRLTKTS